MGDETSCLLLVLVVMLLDVVVEEAPLEEEEGSPEEEEEASPEEEEEALPEEEEEEDTLHWFPYVFDSNVVSYYPFLKNFYDSQDTV